MKSVFNFILFFSLSATAQDKIDFYGARSAVNTVASKQALPGRDDHGLKLVFTLQGSYKGKELSLSGTLVTGCGTLSFNLTNAAFDEKNELLFICRQNTIYVYLNEVLHDMVKDPEAHFSIASPGYNCSLKDERGSVQAVQVESISAGIMYQQPVVKIATAESKTTVNVYPNPVTKELHVTVPAGLITSIRLYSTDGKLLDKKSNRSVVDVSALQPGVYFIRIDTNAGASMHSFIKQ